MLEAMFMFMLWVLHSVDDFRRYDCFVYWVKVRSGCLTAEAIAKLVLWLLINCHVCYSRLPIIKCCCCYLYSVVVAK